MKRRLGHNGFDWVGLYPENEEPSLWDVGAGIVCKGNVRLGEGGPIELQVALMRGVLRERREHSGARGLSESLRASCVVQYGAQSVGQLLRRCGCNEESVYSVANYFPACGNVAGDNGKS